MIPGSVH